MFYNLLESTSGTTDNTGSWTSYIPIIIIVVLLVAFFIWSFVSNRKKQKNFNDTINAVRPGSKVKTIGGIVGEVVEVNDEENTFVLRTGDSMGNVSFMKFDKQAIYQTDAKPEPKAEEHKHEEPAAPQPEAPQAPAAETPAAEEPAPAEDKEADKNLDSDNDSDK